MKTQLHLNHYRKGVVCLDHNAIYESISLASKLTGCNKKSIIHVCKGRRNACYDNLQVKRRWMYLKDYVELYGIEKTLQLNFYDYVDLMEVVTNEKSLV